jgi:hypothetical protein
VHEFPSRQVREEIVDVRPHEYLAGPVGPLHPKRLRLDFNYID